MLDALVRLNAAEQSVDESVRRDAKRGSSLFPGEAIGIDADEVTVRNDKEGVTPSERLANRVSRYVAVGDDRRGEPTDLQAAGVIDLLVGAVVRVEVVGGPDDFVAMLPG